MSEVTSNTELKREQSVSVIIPTYERKTNILRVLDKLAIQTYPASGFEVVVVLSGRWYSKNSICSVSKPTLVTLPTIGEWSGRRGRRLGQFLRPEKDLPSDAKQ